MNKSIPRQTPRPTKQTIPFCSKILKTKKSTIYTKTEQRKLLFSPDASKSSLYISTHNTKIPLFNISKRNASIFDMPTPTGSLVQNNQNDLTSLLENDVEENVSHGLIDFSRGKIVFDARSSINNFARYRVVEHRSTDLTAKEQRLLDDTLSDHALNVKKKKETNEGDDSNDSVYYSFQQLYDEGDEEHDSPYVNIKSVIKAGSDNVNTLHVSSMNALVNALVFSAHPPQRTLYIGNWGGVLPQYISKKIGTDVEIIDSDAMSQYMSKSYSPGIFFDNYNHTGLMNTKLKVNYHEDTPEHPFDIIFTHKKNLLTRRKQQLKLMNLNNISNPDDDIELNENEIDQILAENGENDITNALSNDIDETNRTFSKATSTATNTSLSSLQPTQTEQDQEELDSAHTQLHLEESIVAFQKFRLRGQNTGKVSIFPSIIDANSHLASLYSSYYLDKSRAIPTAINYMTQKRHVKHLETQHQQTHLNVKAMVIDKFNLRGLLQANPTSASHSTKTQYENLVEELNDLRYELLLISRSQFDTEDDIANNSDGADGIDQLEEAMDTTDEEAHIDKRLKMDFNQWRLHKKQKNGQAMTPTQVRLQREKRINDIKLEIFSKRSSIDSLSRVLEVQGPNDSEVSKMAEKVIKWTTRRLNAIETFSTEDVELLGDHSDGDVDHITSVVNEAVKKNEGTAIIDDEGKMTLGGIEFDAKGNMTIKAPQPQQDEIVVTSTVNKKCKPVKHKALLNDIFDSDEQIYADEFNKQFIALLIHDINGEDELQHLNSTFPDIFDPNELGEKAQPTSPMKMATRFNPRLIHKMEQEYNNKLSSKTQFDGDSLDMNDMDDTDAPLNPYDNGEENTQNLFRSFLSSQSMDGIWFQTTLQTLQRYGNTLRTHQLTIKDLEQKIVELKIPTEHMKILSTIHENVLDSIYLPMKGYDVIIHDHENDPITLETLRFIKEALIIEGEDDVVRHGLYVKRSSLVDPSVAAVQYEFIEDWLPNIQKESVRLKNIFKHVYWTQPSHDNIVFVATDSELGSDLTTNHPLDTDVIIDHSVALWQSGAFGLDIIEQSDKWNYISKKGQDIVSLLERNPEAFLHGTEDDLM